MSLVPAFQGVANTTSSLTQQLTNSFSVLGTLDAPTLPQFLSDNPLPYGFPWGTKDVFNTNPYTQSTSTGITRHYDWTVSRHVLSPDGNEKNMIIVNSQFPGPVIEANWGDKIEVTVHNNIQDPPEGTAIHWHGFLLHQTPWMDGTPGLTQCPIAPGSSFTYSFRAELFGTSWWHAHYSSQYADGLIGPIVIHGPNHEEYDIDLGPVLLSDYFHSEHQNLTESLLVPRPGLPPVFAVSDNNLINGKGRRDCSSASNKSVQCNENAGLAKFKFEKDKTHKLRLANTGADGAQQFSIDNHMMTVIANDFVPVKPYDTKIVTLGVGQRTDVLVRATEAANSIHWIRSNITCSHPRNPDALAILYYGDADTDDANLPTSTAWPNPNPGCDNEPLIITEPAYPIPVTDPGPNSTYNLNITIAQNGSFVYLWYLDDVSFRSDYSDPTLLSETSGDAGTYQTIPDNSSNTLTLPAEAKSYRFIVHNNSPSPHPMHLHGHNMYVLAVSNSTPTWDGAITRPNNPQRRDVQQVPPNGYLVLQADADNPGVWGFHCHMVFHSGLGLFMQIVEGGKEKLQALQVLREIEQGCEEWRAFEKTGLAAVIDSGQ